MLSKHEYFCQCQFSCYILQECWSLLLAMSLSMSSLFSVSMAISTAKLEQVCFLSLDFNSSSPSQFSFHFIHSHLDITAKNNRRRRVLLSYSLVNGCFCSFAHLTVEEYIFYVKLQILLLSMYVILYGLRSVQHQT